MARKKVRLEYIENDTSRRVTYKKRVKGLVKKTQELSVLCGVDACAVVYSPYDKSPVVWPSSEPEARRILSEFKRKPEMDQSQRRFTQLTFLKQSVVKSQDRLVKLQRRNRELQIENLMVDIFAGRVGIEQVKCGDLADLMWVVDDKCRSIQHRLQVLQQRETNGGMVGVNVNVNANVNVNPQLEYYHEHGVGSQEEMMMRMMMHGNGHGWYFGGPSSMN